MKPWDRLEGEPNDAYHAFAAWLATEPTERGCVERWARRRGMRPEPTAEISRRWCWVSRANAFELGIATASIEARIELAQLYTAARRDAARAVSANLKTARKAAEHFAARADDAIGALVSSPESTIRMTREAVRTLTELAPREEAPAERSALGRDYSRLTADELALLERLEAKMEGAQSDDD